MNNTQNTNPNPFNEIFNHLMSDWKVKKVEFYKSVMEQHHQGKDIEIKSLSDFNYHYVKPYQKFLEGCISEKFGVSNQLEFLLLNYSFVESHFRQMIVLHDGNACCVDKTRAILTNLGEYLKTGVFVEFDYGNELAYWNPKNIFRTQQQILDFYLAIKQLFHGHVNAYLHFQLTV